jgi:aminoglycoside phosphotransferase (APT) family kinase protein
MPPADIEVTIELARALLRTQHPDLAALPLASLAHGWDNELFRLGNELIVRLPRRELGGRLMDNELRWLPMLAAHCSLPVPLPIRTGEPSGDYPYRWSIVPYLSGAPLGDALLDESRARTLGVFVRDLHVPAPADAPHNPLRGVPLADRALRVERAFAALAPELDVAHVRAVWEKCLAAPRWEAAPVWLHGDLHSLNVLTDGAQLTGVIDFGDLTAGDPATDLMIAYMACDKAARSAFLDESGHDEATRSRARGWAIALGVLFATRDDPTRGTLGRRAIAAAT